jgi:predicted Zn-dependent protease
LGKNQPGKIKAPEALLTLARGPPYHHLVDRTPTTDEREDAVMAEARIEVFKRMLQAEPGNTSVRFGLANELFKGERFEDAASELRAYLAQADDQGAAYGLLARALERLGRTDEARAAYEQGIAAAQRHGHPGMAQEFELAMSELL